MFLKWINLTTVTIDETESKTNVKIQYITFEKVITKELTIQQYYRSIKSDLLFWNQKSLENFHPPL